MSRKYIILNLMVFAMVLFGAVMNYETWSHSNGSLKGAVREPEANPGNPPKPEVSAAKEKPKSLQSYGIIAEKNIFSSDRKEFSSSSLVLAEAPKTSTRPQVILSGVVISDGYQSASVSTPGRPLKKGERDTLTLQPGDRIGGYKLARIEADRITMEAAGDSFEVLLYDRKKTRVEAKTAIQPAPEVKTGQPPPAVPPNVDPAKVESLEKPMEPANKRVIAQASSFARKDIHISRSRRSEAIRQSLRNSGQQSVADGTPKNEEK